MITRGVSQYSLNYSPPHESTEIVILDAQVAMQRGVHTVRVVIRGLGAARITAIKGLEMAGLTVVSITDATPLSNQHPRPRKVRRV